MKMRLTIGLFASLSVWTVAAETISEINGVNYLSPFKDRNVTDVTGLVTGKGPDGFWIRSTTPDDDRRTSESIYVFGRASVSLVTVGDIVTLDGKVEEFRNNNLFLYLTEITGATNIRTVSKDNAVTPVQLGRGRLAPPMKQYSSLDGGDVFAVPNNVARISTSNPRLRPDRVGLDFWESLTGELVTILKPRAVSKSFNRFQEQWVVGDWKTSGDNKRGGITMTDAGKEGLARAMCFGTLTCS
jgi:hypothetical protein